ncbi:MAG: phospholipase A [Pseudomonadota bacterium]
MKKILLVFVFMLTIPIFSQDKAPTKSGEDLSDRISKHNDFYAIFGAPNTKFQISLKYKISSYIDLYFGYTQIMFWELGQTSMPFSDINFNPDLFYRLKFSEDTFIKAIDLGIFEHKSDGKAGADSRAWSGSYVKLYTIVKFYQWSFNWDTKVKWFYGGSFDDNNRDYREYSGWWDMRFSLINYFEPEKFIDRIVMYFAFFSGGSYSQCIAKGGQEIGLGMRLGWGTFNPMMFFQVYNGYNESLLRYNQRYTAYRIGIAF